MAAVTAIVGDRHRAEEIVQVAFERCFRRWNRVSKLDRPGAWARRVAINEAISVLRRASTEQRAVQDPEVPIDLTVLAADGDGGLTETSKITDLSDGEGAVTAVRFVEDRVLISTGFFGREIHVIDVSEVAEPRRAGTVNGPGAVGYLHPLADQQALVVGSRSDTVGEGRNKMHGSWVQVHLLDVADADAPQIVSTWERPWSADNVGSDHHVSLPGGARHRSRSQGHDRTRRCGPAVRGLVNRFMPEGERDGTFFSCSLAPQPTVSRVLVVSGTPMLFTDQTLETLDPETFESTAIAYHPSGYMFWW